MSPNLSEIIEFQKGSKVIIKIICAKEENLKIDANCDSSYFIIEGNIT